jgi:HEAT repeat protein
MLGDEAVDELTVMLKTVDPWRRKLVVRALRFTKSKLALPVFLKILADKKEEISARIEAALSLAGFGEKEVVEALISALEDHNSGVRAQSACSLGLLSDSWAVEPLIKIIKDIDKTVRACAAQALGEIGDKRAAKPLTNALEDINSRVRFYAICALSEIGDESAFEPLLKALENRKTNCGAIPKALAITGGKKAIPHLIKLFNSIFDKEASREILRFGKAAIKPLLAAAKSDRSSTKVHALKALAHLREEKAFSLILEALNDESKRVRETAAEAIALYKDARAVEPLIQLLRDESVGVRLQAAYSLGHLRDQRAAKPLIAVLLDDDKENPRRTAAYALAEIGDKTAIEPLISVLLDEEEESSIYPVDFRCAAVRALVSFKEARVVEVLIKRLEDEENDIAGAAMRVLGEIGDRRATPPLIKMGPVDRTAAVLRKLRAPESVDFFLSVLEKNKNFLMSNRWDVLRGRPFDISFGDVIDCRMSAIYALGEISDRRAVEPLEELLSSKSTCICMAAAIALLHLGDENVEDVLKKALGGEDSELQRDAVDAILESPHSKAIPWLTEVLKRSRSRIVRNNAAAALGRLGDKRASDALIEALADKNMFVRSTAAEALGEFKEKRAVEQLVKLLSSDPDLEVRESALEALHEITGQNFGWNWQAWRRWYEENREK